MLIFRRFFEYFHLAARGRLAFNGYMLCQLIKPRNLRIPSLCLLAAMAGCANSPMPASFANHFDSAREDATHGQCMSDNAMFNNRQLMVAPTAVQNAWTYCVKQSDVWYPGKDSKAEPSAW